MDITFLGTGGAWGVPELNCDCLICREMRRKGEKRELNPVKITIYKMEILDYQEKIIL